MFALKSSRDHLAERGFFAVVLLAPILSIAFIAYNRLRGLGYFDGSEYALHIGGSGIAHAPGYPLFTILGKAIHALGADPFLSQQVVSMAALPLTAFALYATFALEVGRRRSGFAAALAVTILTFVGGYYVRLFAILPEVFILNLALFALLIWAVTHLWYHPEPRKLGIVFLVYGLGFCHHHTLAFTLPGCLFLVAKRLPRTQWPKAFGYALLGFLVGCLPLIYLFVGSRGAEHTYYRVHDLSSLLFVLLREGYGTFRLSPLQAQADLAGLYRLALEGILQNLNHLGVLVLIPLLLVRVATGSETRTVAAPPRAYSWRSPSLIVAISTLVVFFCVFVPNCNLELTTRTYRYIFLRFLTIPCFLLSYVIFKATLQAWDWAAKWGVSRQNTLMGAMVAGLVIASSANVGGLRYRNSDLMDEHIRQGYQAIASQIRPDPVAGDGRHHKCLIFAQGDTLFLGLRYYNEFVARQQCYLYGVASFSGHFLNEPELRLASKTLGVTRSALESGKLATQPEALFNLFLKLDREGYSIFVFSVTDYTSYFGKFFANSPFAYRPVGNVLQVVTNASAPWGMDRIYASFNGYLSDMEAYLNRLDRQGVVSEVADSQANQALVLNLYDYARFVPHYPVDAATKSALQQRAAAVEARWLRLVPRELHPLQQ